MIMCIFALKWKLYGKKESFSKILPMDAWLFYGSYALESFGIY